MKKNFIRLFATLLLGGSVAVYNYTGADIILEDGTTIKTKDLPTHLIKEYDKRPLNDTDSLTIYIHHTAVTSKATVESIANYHVRHNGWAGIGYHSAIKPNGDILLLNSLHTISYHTRGQNTKGISIVLWGNYNKDKVSDKMLESVKLITESLCNILPIKAIKAHRDAPNASTSCCGDNAYKTLKEQNIFF